MTSLGGVEFEEVDEFADVVAVLGGVAHCGLEVEAVVVSSSDSFAAEIAGFDQVGDDSLGGAFRDADALGEVAEACVWVAVQAEEDLRVVGEESPAGCALWA